MTSWTFYGLDENIVSRSHIGFIFHASWFPFAGDITMYFTDRRFILEMELEHPCEALEI